MRVTITIQCDNAAFEDTEMEVSRILADYARRLADGLSNIRIDTMLRDYNGNRVGAVKVTGRRPKERD